MYDSINTAYQRLAENMIAPEIAALDRMIRMYQYDEAHELVEKIVGNLETTE